MEQNTDGKGRFCVISPTVDASGHKRTWFKTIDGAVGHGRRLANRNAERGQKQMKLFVVQVVRVLETPPIITVTERAPTDDEDEWKSIVEDDG